MEKPDPTSWVMLGATACLVVVSLFIVHKLTSLDSKLAAVLMQTDRSTMQTITQTVTRANGTTVTVTTQRKEGESIADWIARHDAAVAALEA